MSEENTLCCVHIDILFNFNDVKLHVFTVKYLFLFNGIFFAWILNGVIIGLTMISASDIIL